MDKVTVMRAAQGLLRRQTDPPAAERARRALAPAAADAPQACDCIGRSCRWPWTTRRGCSRALERNDIVRLEAMLKRLEESCGQRCSGWWLA